MQGLACNDQGCDGPGRHLSSLGVHKRRPHDPTIAGHHQHLHNSSSITIQQIVAFLLHMCRRWVAQMVQLSTMCKTLNVLCKTWPYTDPDLSKVFISHAALNKNGSSIPLSILKLHSV